MRAHWEPVVEVTQYKGDSETHPDLSPDDPFADFETYEGYIQQGRQPYVAGRGDYARSALLRGLEIEARVGANPYKFGMVGATDSHTGLAAYEEDNFWGKMALDSTPETKPRFVGDPTNPAHLQVPQISRRQQERVLAYIEKGRQEGARRTRTEATNGGEPIARADARD